MTKKKDGNSVMFESFIGEFVSLTTNSTMTITETDSSGNQIMQTAHVQIEGFFVDMDEEFILLSQDNQTVSEAVNIKSIISIRIIQDPKTHEEMVDLLNTEALSKELN
jgi:hypothetical protein